MIRLSKGRKPEILTQKQEEWTKALLAAIKSDEKPTETIKGRYRHPQIKTAIVDETYGKCAYCESKVRHIAHGDIEHIIPKSIEPQLTFEWDNMTLACDRCNENKSDHFANHDDLVDPYAVNPDDHFFIEGPLVLPVPGDEAAELTEKTIKLNRLELVEMRKKRIQSLHDQVKNIAKTHSEDLRAVLKQDLINNETSNDTEYAALARSFVPRCLELIER
jgi:uncharacterized protein (TIGR02646 family)